MACGSWHPYRGARYPAPCPVVSACGLNHRLLAVIPPGFSGTRAKAGLRVVGNDVTLRTLLQALPPRRGVSYAATRARASRRPLRRRGLLSPSGNML